MIPSKCYTTTCVSSPEGMQRATCYDVLSLCACQHDMQREIVHIFFDRKVHAMCHRYLQV